MSEIKGIVAKNGGRKPAFVKELEAEPKVQTRIKSETMSDGQKDSSDVPVSINGYTWLIKRDVLVEVPKTIFDLLAGAGYV